VSEKREPAALLPRRSGLYGVPRSTDALRRAAVAAGVAWIDLDLERVAGKREFLATCARGMGFPAHFGGNWDALADCLKDRTTGCVVHLRNGAAFAAAVPDDCATALAVFQDAAESGRERGIVFIVLADATPAGSRLATLVDG